MNFVQENCKKIVNDLGAKAIDIFINRLKVAYLTLKNPALRKIYNDKLREGIYKDFRPKRLKGVIIKPRKIESAQAGLQKGQLQKLEPKMAVKKSQKKTIKESEKIVVDMKDLIQSLQELSNGLNSLQAIMAS